MTQYPEYFVSYYENNTLCYCCNIGNLSIAEVALFKKESGIKDNPDFVLHKGVSLSINSVVEIQEHHEALGVFANAQIYCMAQWNPTPPEIKTMLEYLRLASDIRAERPKSQPKKKPKKNDPPYETLSNEGKNARIMEAVIYAQKHPEQHLNVIELNFCKIE